MFQNGKRKEIVPKQGYLLSITFSVSISWYRVSQKKSSW